MTSEREQSMPGIDTMLAYPVCIVLNKLCIIPTYPAQYRHSDWDLYRNNF